jgi:GDP-L-fucose synthase
MPTNLYGPEDNFDLETSHVLPAMIHKFHLARETAQPAMTLWGTGNVHREFLHVDDLARACLFLMETYDSPELINVGCGQDITIRELAGLVAEVVDYSGRIEWDASKPDGTPRKLLDISRLTGLGWKASVPLNEGLRATYRWWLENRP